MTDYLAHERAVLGKIRAIGCARDQFTSAIDVAVEMGRGPSRVYGVHALGNFDAVAAG